MDNPGKSLILLNLCRMTLKFVKGVKVHIAFVMDVVL